VNAAKEGHKVKCINVKGLAANLTKNELEGIEEEAKKIKGQVLLIRVLDNEWKSPIAKHLSENERKEISAKFNIQNGDLLMITAGPHLKACTTLGRLRLHTASLLQEKKMLVIPADQYNFMWVVDFPLFSEEGDPPALCATHHPFTAPVPEDAHLIDGTAEDLLKIRGLHYDCVVNGVELGGGSIRIHNHKMQSKIFERLQFSPFMTGQFHHLLEALRFGCPPHGGLALGMDRMIAMLTGSSSLREVIAFPKTLGGRDPLTSAPSEVPEADLLEFGIKIVKTPEKK